MDVIQDMPKAESLRATPDSEMHTRDYSRGYVQKERKRKKGKKGEDELISLVYIHTQMFLERPRLRCGT